MTRLCRPPSVLVILILSWLFFGWIKGALNSNNNSKNLPNETNFGENFPKNLKLKLESNQFQESVFENWFISRRFLFL